MSKAELHEISTEVDQINSEMDWRCPNLEWRWFEWADSRLGYLIEILEKSEKKTRASEIGLRVIRGGAA
jgi:hypothetical protein